MFEVIHACAHTGAERLAAHIDVATEDGRGTRLDIMDWTWRIALDIIGRVAFDYDFGSGESENAREIHQSWMDQINSGFDRMGIIVSRARLREPESIDTGRWRKGAFRVASVSVHC